MNTQNDLVKRLDLVKDTYFDDNGRYVVVLNENYIKKLFKADILTFKK